MANNKSSFLERWTTEKLRQRSDRARARQLEYQEKKAVILHEHSKETAHNIFMRAQTIRRRLEEIRSIPDKARILEVGSGAHGLIFGFSGSNNSNFSVGVDPLAVDYKKLFPVWQLNVQTIGAIGEELPFADATFDIVLSDNVIDHAEKPVKITEEFARVLKPKGLLYFTVNIHHPIYELASKAHGVWNAFGVHFEISPFADHTVHFSENEIKRVMRRLPIKILQENSTVEQTKTSYRQSNPLNVEQQLKKLFFKNAVYEIIALRN